jgi:hypothetical protein
MSVEKNKQVGMRKENEEIKKHNKYQRKFKFGAISSEQKTGFDFRFALATHLICMNNNNNIHWFGFINLFLILLLLSNE